MAFIRGGARPDHVHIDPECTNHLECGAEHWEGGRPESHHPHHVEADCSTGLVGYTRLTADEIARQKAQAERILTAEREAQEKYAQRIAVIREKARTDPGFAALAEHLGIPLDA